MKKIPKILIIAGSDSCGGAGIQADIKIATALKTYAASAITCLTAQNTKGVFDISYPSIDFLKKQISVVLDDIKFDAIKIGMLGNTETIDAVADILQAKAKKIPLILDTVMVATSGDLLLEKNAIQALESRLIKGCYLATPNIDEAEILTQEKISTLDDVRNAAMIIKALGAKNVLIKGGHLKSKDSQIHNIFLDEKNNFHIISNPKVKIKKIHGTGCSLASAIACNVAKKMSLAKAIKNANQFLFKKIQNSAKIGGGSNVLIY
jgi:hydroxymethylpyrimidine/phosphomethylpyrimidine kinase